MIRKITSLLFVAILLAGCENNKFTINGELEGSDPGSYIYLDKLGGTNLEPYDSVMIADNGSFKFSGEVEHPEFFLLKISDSNFLTTLVEPGDNITINAYADSLGFTAEVEGSPGTSKMIEYDQRLQQAMDELQELGEIYQSRVDSPDLDQVMTDLDTRAQAILEDMNEYTRNFIDENIESMVSLIALYKQVTPQVYVLNIEEDLEYYKRVDSTLSALYPESEPVKTLHSQLETVISSMENSAADAGNVGIGTVAPEIALPSPEGDVIKLSSTRGQYVLLDFWAAWCSPCRRENPNLVEAYEKYSDEGFEIFQVSLDQTREAWLEGIEEDNLDDWIHVSDLKYWSSEVVPLYGIESIPTNYLLDQEGRIIAANLRGEALVQKLSELFE
ncbi:MAG: thioredoxin-like domain-containing protein [Bacteroidales bacterium]